MFRTVRQRDVTNAWDRVRVEQGRIQSFKIPVWILGN